MRKILFRGKRTDNERWHYGYVVHSERDSSWGITNENEHYQDVDGSTIGQYTGLNDRNGVRIFEGDILAGYNYPFTSDGEQNYYAVVVWFENSPAFGIETVKAPGSSVSGISNGNTSYMEDWDPQCWEVIGNIHDNPELLEVKK